VVEQQQPPIDDQFDDQFEPSNLSSSAGDTVDTRGSASSDTRESAPASAREPAIDRLPEPSPPANEVIVSPAPSQPNVPSDAPQTSIDVAQPIPSLGGTEHSDSEPSGQWGSASSANSDGPTLETLGNEIMRPDAPAGPADAQSLTGSFDPGTPSRGSNSRAGSDADSILSQDGD
jgi:hypothetical protein